jgi:flavin reductase (DIM6/NTAB) family NADH-FMN oxidoreductase RutF
MDSLDQGGKRMQADAKKTTLRMIPYGIYVLTADDGKGNVGAATVNWVTQTAFAPPLVAVGVKTDSGSYGIIKATGQFALNMLGKDHKGLAFTFFKPAKVEDGKLSGQAYKSGANGAPILDASIGAIECKVVQVVELGDHHVFLGEVTEAHLNQPPAGRPDHAILAMSDLGDNVFYGG